MRTCLMSAFCLLLSLTAIAQEAPSQDPVLAEAAERKAYVMAYMNDILDLDDRTQRLAGTMVDVYLQSVIRMAAQMPVSDRSRPSYDKVRENHFELLGNYLSEDQIARYQEALSTGGDENRTCIYCAYPKKADRQHCVFCGSGFEE